MHIDFLGILDSLWQVLVVGLIFGAGLPALFSLGIRALGKAPQTADATAAATSAESVPSAPSAGQRLTAWLCFGLCIAVAAFGIVVIIFGKQMFG